MQLKIVDVNDKKNPWDQCDFWEYLSISFSYFFAIFLLFFFLFTVRLALNRQEIWQQRFEICQNNTKIKFCYVLIFDIRYLTFHIWHLTLDIWHWYWHWLWLAMEINWVLEPLRDRSTLAFRLTILKVNPPEPWEISKGPIAQISCVLRLKLKLWDQFEEQTK